jgi:hypothetical protein
MSKWRTAAVLAGYSAISFLYFGVRIARHAGRDYAGNGADPQIFVWMFGWWPHALLHGESPLGTHAIWAPDGVARGADPALDGGVLHRFGRARRRRRARVRRRAGAGNGMLWQAEDGFRFRQAGGYVRPAPPDSFLRWPAKLVRAAK